MKTLTAGRYEVTISKRQPGATDKYQNYFGHALYSLNTPKAKFHKQKILHSYVYKTYEEAILRAQEWINNIQSNMLAREVKRKEAQEKNKMVNAADFYKIGDIIVNTWGYEQTNVDFYSVVKVTNKTITIKEISQIQEDESIYSHGMACNMLPGDDIVKDGSTYTLRVKDEGNLSNPKSFFYMRKWEGKPMYCSWYY